MDLVNIYHKTFIENIKFENEKMTKIMFIKDIEELGTKVFILTVVQDVKGNIDLGLFIFIWESTHPDGPGVTIPSTQYRPVLGHE